MQSANVAFTAEEDSSVRSIAQNLQVSWKKDSILGNRTFTIGVSIVGGNDIIGINPGAIGSPGNYRYFDESDYVLSLAWEHGFNIPLGGFTKGLAEADLDNTSGRFIPDYAGGTRAQSELFTAILPRRPFIINAGFELGGTKQILPQFSGILSKQPEVNRREGVVRIEGSDYLDFFENRFIDQETMFTAQRTDQVIETLFQSSGLSTAQYELDEGLNTIPFGLFEKGTKFKDIMNEMVQAEGGHLYQDEMGIFKFENRQHWYGSPHSTIQRILTTAQVLEDEVPSEDNIINVVEISSPIREKQPAQTIFNLSTLSYIEVPGSSTIERFFEFQDPVLQLTHPTIAGVNSYYAANSAPDESGSDQTSSITITNSGTFARSVKYRIINSSASTVYITQLVLSGRVAKETSQLYYRDSRSSSVTAYEERVLSINNKYIQNLSWAQSYAQLIFGDYADLQGLRKITIRAIPGLQIGDLVEYQSNPWRVYDIKSKLNPSEGYLQELTMLKRSVQNYFTIGVSTIGGEAIIAP